MRSLPEIEKMNADPIPCKGSDATESGLIVRDERCATLRDQFAMAALSGLGADPNTADMECETVARCCYKMADAMLAAREDKPCSNS